ncbi:MAG: NADPH-dependent 7-cyano-7-deazaguanine reductase QueF, partial [Nitrospinota bacterium]|nr:NADPH-dependent 7-cyano-7-deazaguanine reductase QueF [Nitrospinota bacterium]
EVFHEQAVNRILDDLVACCAPKWAWIEGDFNVRGNIKTKIRATHGQRPAGVPD